MKLGEVWTYKDSNNNDVKETITEIKNKANIVYTEVPKTTTTETESVTETETNTITESTDEAGTTNGSTTTIDNGTPKTNSISIIERISNQVETDVTHLYMNIEKQVNVDDNYNMVSSGSDEAQSFLMQIAYYTDSSAYISGNASDIYYTRINCNQPVCDTDGTSVVAYTGSQTVQCDKRGIYVVSEVTDWSNTDYDYETATSTDIATLDEAGNLIYPKQVVLTGANISIISTANYSKTSNSNTTGSGDAATGSSSVLVELPRLAYASGAFPTSFGTNINEAPTITFENKASIYAYLSSQAYSENNIQR